jgi:hypothetical protein
MTGDLAARLPRPGTACSTIGELVGHLLSLANLGLAAEAGLAIDLHPAGAADRGAAGAADRERAVVAVLDLEQAVEDGERGIELDLELLPVGPLFGLGLETADLQRVLGHQ